MADYLPILALVVSAVIGIFIYLKGFCARNLILIVFALYPVIVLNRFLDSPIEIGSFSMPQEWIAVGLISTILLLFVPYSKSVKSNNRNMWMIHLSMLLLLIVLSFGILANAKNGDDLVTGVTACLYLYLPFLFAFIITRTLSITPANAERIIFVFCLGGLLTTGISALSAFAPTLFSAIITTGKTDSLSGRGFAPIGGPSAIGMQLVAVYALALSMFFGSKKKAFYIVVMAVIFVGILSTLARAVIISFVFVNIAFIIAHAGKRIYKAIIPVAVSALVLIPLFVLFSHFSSMDRLVSGFGDDGNANGQSVFIRESSQLAAFKYGLENPLTGGGWGLVYKDARGQVEGASNIMFFLDDFQSAFKPHSLFALFFAEAGFPGLIAVCIFLYLLLKYTKPPKKEKSPQGFYIVQGFRLGIIANLVMCLAQDHFALVTKLSFFFYLYALIGCCLANTYRKALESETVNFANKSRLTSSQSAFGRARTRGIAQ